MTLWPPKPRKRILENIADDCMVIKIRQKKNVRRVCLVWWDDRGKHGESGGVHVKAGKCLVVMLQSNVYVG